MMTEGAIVTHLKNMGPLTLIDPLKKQKSVHYFIVQCELPEAKIPKIARALTK